MDSIRRKSPSETTKRRIRNSIIIILLLVSYVVYFNSEPATYPEGYYGKPAISTDYPEINIGIEQVVDDGERIYILFQHSNGIVQVCDLDGNYLYTLFFYCNLNGSFSIAVDNSQIYVRDMKGNIYIFSDGELISFLEQELAQSLTASIDFNARTSSPDYVIQSNTLWRKTDQGEICIVGRETTNLNFQSKLLFASCALLVIGMLCMKLYRKKSS